MELVNEDGTTESGEDDAKRIELTWPGKGLRPSTRADGSWQLKEFSATRVRYPLHLESREGNGDSLVIEGERLAALTTLRGTLGHRIKVVYADLPRIEIDDRTRAFQSASDRVYSTYLSVVREHFREVMSLLRRDGVVIAHVGDAEEPYVRLVLEELFGRDQRVGSIVWQRHYAPRNQKNMKEFTATHDVIVVFAIDKQLLPPVVLRMRAEGFANPDGDPRGAWKAEHKGARTRRSNTDYEINIPPYRWQLVEGTLPPGLWRVSPMAGVIWGQPSTVGRFPFVMQVTDADGQAASAQLEIVVTNDGTFTMPNEVPWLFGDPPESRGDLRITLAELPQAVLGQPYSAFLQAQGGTPFQGKRRPGAGRYWEFPDYTLVNEIVRDNVSFGVRGDSIPHPKSHIPPGTENPEVQRNQLTWWPARPGGQVIFCDTCPDADTDALPGADPPLGFTQDATKHLKKLVEAGLLESWVTTAKPERLLERLLRIFSDPGDFVLELFGDSGVASSVATKMGRQFILLGGDTSSDVNSLQSCVIPRLRAVVSGQDSGWEFILTGTRIGVDHYIPFEGGSGFSVFKLGPPFVEKRSGDEYPSLVHDLLSSDRWKEEVVTAEGFLPAWRDEDLDGVSLDGRAAAIVLDPTTFLTQSEASDITTRVLERFDALALYYFRSADDFMPEEFPASVLFKRVPIELGV